MIDAIQFTEAMANLDVDLPEDVYCASSTPDPESETMNHEFIIQTHRGNLSISVGDWIVNSYGKEKHVYSPEAFECLKAQIGESTVSELLPESLAKTYSVQKAMVAGMDTNAFGQGQLARASGRALESNPYRQVNAYWAESWDFGWITQDYAGGCCRA